VVEVCSPRRLARRTPAKTDTIDAVRAAHDALATDQPATARRRGDREALRALLACRPGATSARVAAISQLKALIVSAPDSLRAQVRDLTAKLQIRACATLPDDPTQPLEQRMTALALRSAAQRIHALVAEAKLLERQIDRLVRAVAPWLLELPGVGALSAAQLLVSWSHPGRCRSEAAFAALAGPAHPSLLRASHPLSAHVGSLGELIAAGVPGCMAARLVSGRRHKFDSERPRIWAVSCR
jgi:transposase